MFDGSSEIPADAVLDDLAKCAERNPDVIVEVAHPSITKQVKKKKETYMLQNLDILHRKRRSYYDVDIWFIH